MACDGIFVTQAPYWGICGKCGVSFNLLSYPEADATAGVITGLQPHLPGVVPPRQPRKTTRTFRLEVTFDEAQTTSDNVLRELKFHLANHQFPVEPSRPDGKIGHLKIDSVVEETKP
jgi:hypothetical protein